MTLTLALASGDALGGLTAFDHEYAAFNTPAARTIETWTRPQQLAFWIKIRIAFLPYDWSLNEVEETHR